jgi:hypothetical protein
MATLLTKSFRMAGARFLILLPPDRAASNRLVASAIMTAAIEALLLIVTSFPTPETIRKSKLRTFLGDTAYGTHSDRKRDGVGNLRQ